jgi:hypothetical protein
MPLLKEVIPAEIQDKPWAKDFLTMEQTPESFAKVFTKLDGAEALIGKRPSVPTKESKPEDWDAFFNTLRPEKSDEYEFKLGEQAKNDDPLLKDLREAFHAGALNKRQAEKFMGAFLPKLEARVQADQKKAQELRAKQDAEFETLVKTGLGEKSKEIMARVNGALKELAPAALKPHIDKLDNNSLVIMAGVIDAVMKKYMPEDELKRRTTDTGSDDNSAAGRREKGRLLMASEAYKDPWHPEHEKIKAQVAAIYEEFNK